MSTFLRTIEFLSLSLWLGSDVFLSFVVAPGACHVRVSPVVENRGNISRRVQHGYDLN